MATGTTGDLNKVTLPNSFGFGGFYNNLERNAKNSYYDGNLKIPAFRNGQADKTIIASRRYEADKGDFILKPLNFNIDNKRPTTDYFDGRNMNILNTLKANAKNGGKTQPTVTTVNPREVVGRV